MKVLMEISYVGSEFCGWQVQRNALSVQKTVQTAAETLLKSPCAVTGCSRTDAGVHARQYFCTLENENLDRFPLDRLPLALNCLLPETVGVRDAFPVEKDFHPRYRALGKEYEYLIHGGRLKNPFLSERAFFCGRMPDTDCMQREAQDLVGTHDFSSFCASGGKVEDKTRTVYFCRVEKLPGEQVSLRICADGFLYNMVRIIAGMRTGRPKKLRNRSVFERPAVRRADPSGPRTVFGPGVLPEGRSGNAHRRGEREVRQKGVPGLGLRKKRMDGFESARGGRTASALQKRERKAKSS